MHSKLCGFIRPAFSAFVIFLIVVNAVSCRPPARLPRVRYRERKVSSVHQPRLESLRRRKLRYSEPRQRHDRHFGRLVRLLWFIWKLFAAPRYMRRKDPPAAKQLLLKIVARAQEHRNCIESRRVRPV